MVGRHGAGPRICISNSFPDALGVGPRICFDKLDVVTPSFIATDRAAKFLTPAIQKVA